VPLLSSKQADFHKFAAVVRGMASGTHLTPAGFGELLDVALSMNGAGRFRRVPWKQVVATRILRDCTPDRAAMARKIQSELHGDMQSQAEMT
jgi:hypothetical protein